MSAVVLRRIGAAQNMARFYRLDVQPDLFGGWRLHSGMGAHRAVGDRSSNPLPPEAEAFAALERQRRIKQKRGYAGI